MTTATNDDNHTSIGHTLSDDNTTKIKLKSYDGNIHEVGLSAIKLSNYVKDKLINGQKPADHSKPIAIETESANDNVLKKIIEWLEYHWQDPVVDHDYDGSNEGISLLGQTVHRR